ncbi:MAG: transposase [Alicyclobacillus shizuokensis]|nr:transposase [Alicyclobacillus shizuokensis]
MKSVRNANDVLAKHLTGACPDGVLDVIGIRHAPVLRALPTELYEVVIRQQFTDIVFELCTGEILHLEFQSSRERTLNRFLAYDVALAQRFHRKIRTVILYTGNVHSGMDMLDLGSVQYRVENLFLNRINGDDALDAVKEHLARGEWSEQDRIRLAFAFHMQFEKRSRDEAFVEVLELTRQIVDQAEQNYVTALILGLSGRSLTDGQKQLLKEMMRMTDVVRELVQEIEQEAWEKGHQAGLMAGFQEGREEGRKEGRQEGLKKGRQEGLKEGAERKAKEVARNLLAEGIDVDVIAKATGFSREKIDSLRMQQQ